MTCVQTTKKLTPIKVNPERSTQSESPVTRDEQEQLMSVTGSLMWICRCSRPGIAYSVSKLQSAVRKAVVSDLLLANKVVKYVQDDPDAGITFRAGLQWPEVVGEKPTFSIAAVSDASHGGEFEYLDDWKAHEAFRSQGAKLIFLADPGIATNERATVHLISFGSTVQKRVVNSTIKAETYQITDVVEAADLIRATVADLHGQLDHDDWERTAAAWTHSVWFTDCRSAYDTLQKPIAKSVDKRLGIELAALRQLLWRRPGSASPDRRELEERPREPTDLIRWIDTVVMVADCLTKAMKENYLRQVLDTNVWDLKQPQSAKDIKSRKQQQRRRKDDDVDE